jgi:hypothetical protein
LKATGKQFLPLSVAQEEADFLAELTRTLTSVDRNSINHLKKVESQLRKKCRSLPKERSCDIVDRFRSEMTTFKLAKGMKP